MKTLRRRLFGTHLQVMFVALLVVLVGVLVFGAVAVLLGEAKGIGGPPEPGRDREGPLGLFVGLGAAAIAAALVSWRVTNRLAQPLEEIGQATQALAAGRYDVRVPHSDTVELDALATNVNDLADELRTTEERRLRLIGDVAHELRNPLSTIEGTMEGLLDGVVPATDETFARIGREAARLRRLADDLSSLSAAGEPGRIVRSIVDLAAIARDVVAQLEPQAQAKTLSLRLETPARAVLADGDRDRLTQVLTNVVGNAVQYTDSGSVSVTVETAPHDVVVTVSDTGRGLASGDDERIFERFHRVDQHFSDGTGVGLAIARMLVHAHGGSIEAYSAGLDQGMTVRIALPAPD